jgi:hypothetical protein
LLAFLLLLILLLVFLFDACFADDPCQDYASLFIFYCDKTLMGTLLDFMVCTSAALLKSTICFSPAVILLFLAFSSTFVHHHLCPPLNLQLINLYNFIFIPS